MKYYDVIDFLTEQHINYKVEFHHYDNEMEGGKILFHIKNKHSNKWQLTSYYFDKYYKITQIDLEEDE